MMGQFLRRGAAAALLLVVMSGGAQAQKPFVFTTPQEYVAALSSDARLLLFVLRGKFLVQDVFAEHDAIVADVNAGAGDEFLHFRV